MYEIEIYKNDKVTTEVQAENFDDMVNYILRKIRNGYINMQVYIYTDNKNLKLFFDINKHTVKEVLDFIKQEYASQINEIDLIKRELI